MKSFGIDSFMRDCTLCPRMCHADRRVGVGYCGQGNQIRAARAALHMWEEPCISGETGSGAVFFTGCTLGCVYCQNRKIADGSVGKEISVERLAEIFLELQEQGAANINLVTATHFLPQTVIALQRAKEQGLAIPVVYNTSGYERAETLRMLEGLVDIYLPDFKYLDGALAKKYSFAEDYPAVAKAALDEMVRQVGNPVFEAEICVEHGKIALTSSSRGNSVFEAEICGEGEKSRQSRTAECWKESAGNGRTEKASAFGEEKGEGMNDIMRRGVIVRHLVLPGMTRQSKDVIRFLYETYGDRIYISILNQYTPMPGLSDFPELSRGVTRREYESVVDFAIDLGVTQGFIQEGKTAKESFIPEFDITGV